MCYQIVELYSACRCLYYQHAVDRCAAFDRPGHSITRKTILVGYACANHSAHATRSEDVTGALACVGVLQYLRVNLLVGHYQAECIT